MKSSETGEIAADVAVLVVAYNSRATIERCLAAVRSQSLAPDEIHLLENGSPSDGRIEPPSSVGTVNFVQATENLGFAGGNNLLASRAKAGWLALLNPDAFPRHDWLAQFSAARQRYPECAIFGSTQLSAEDPDILDGVGDCYHALGLAFRAGYGRRSMPPPDGEVFAACGAALFIRRDVFEALGGFESRFFCYNEDVDLCFRARLAGHQVIQLQGAIVEHLGYGSSGRRSAFATYHGVRNRLWVFVRNTPGWLFWLLLPGHVVATLALFFSACRFGLARDYARAVIDALAAWPTVWRERRRIQSTRSVAASRIAALMNWGIGDLFTRKVKIRRVLPDNETSRRSARGS